MHTCDSSPPRPGWGRGAARCGCVHFRQGVMSLGQWGQGMQVAQSAMMIYMCGSSRHARAFRGVTHAGFGEGLDQLEHGRGGRRKGGCWGAITIHLVREDVANKLCTMHAYRLCIMYRIRTDCAPCMRTDCAPCMRTDCAPCMRTDCAPCMRTVCTPCMCTVCAPCMRIACAPCIRTE